MKVLYGLFFTVIMTCSMSYAAGPKASTFGKFIWVEENHARIEEGGNSYILDTYVIPFRQPYNITIKSDDNNPINREEAVKIAVDYIKPRGCTQSLSRRRDLDQHYFVKTLWVIGVEC